MMQTDFRYGCWIRLDEHQDFVLDQIQVLLIEIFLLMVKNRARCSATLQNYGRQFALHQIATLCVDL